MRRLDPRALGVAATFLIGACAGTVIDHLMPASPAAADDGEPAHAIALPDMVERVSPSVVTVGAVKKQRYVDPWRSSFFRPYIYEREEREPFMGSGFLDRKSVV